MSLSYCEKCGATLHHGDWPMCPHGRASFAAHGDEIPGGLVIENLDHEPMTFYSKKAIAQAADARGLRIKDEWAGPHDRVLSPSAGVTEKMLRDAAELMSRGSQKKSTTAETSCATLKTSVTEFTIPGVSIEVDA